MKTITVIFTNDAPEIACAPGTPEEKVKELMQEVTGKNNEGVKHHGSIKPFMYVHTHEVKYYDGSEG